MNMKETARQSLASTVLSAFALLPAAAFADSGVYIGGSIGDASLEADFGGEPGFPSSFDENDGSYKLFVGYQFDLPVINLGLEAGYSNFGEPGVDVLGETFSLEATGTNLWATAGLDAGPLNIYAKLGYLLWDAKAVLMGESLSDDGSDMGYGVGLSFGLGPVSIRGEYELYDIEDADLTMLSVGISYLFD